MTTTLIAINKITRKKPDSNSLVVAGYDGDGEPIMRIDSETIDPGFPFEEHDPAEVKWLIDNGAARLPSDNEALMHARQASGSAR